MLNQITIQQAFRAAFLEYDVQVNTIVRDVSEDQSRYTQQFEIYVGKEKDFELIGVKLFTELFYAVKCFTILEQYNEINPFILCWNPWHGTKIPESMKELLEPKLSKLNIEYCNSVEEVIMKMNVPVVKMETLENVENVTVSSDTLRTEDLINAFIDYIPEDHYAYDDLYSEYTNLGNYECEEAIYLLEDLVDVLNQLAPANYYFGSHPGDGACFGFWEVEEEE